MGMRTDPRGKSRPLTTVSVPLLVVYTVVAFLTFVFLQTGKTLIAAFVQSRKVQIEKKNCSWTNLRQ
jgi:hypothetical protein